MNRLRRLWLNHRWRSCLAGLRQMIVETKVALALAALERR